MDIGVVLADEDSEDEVEDDVRDAEGQKVCTNKLVISSLISAISFSLIVTLINIKIM